MKTLHISAECYPAAKAGGLGDVVGALPKYLIKAGTPAAVVLPKYNIPWINSRHSTVVFSGAFLMANGYHYPFSIEQIGIHDLQRPDFGDPVEIRDGELPVFWACGVTPQSVAMAARPPFCITHSPGSMLITDLLNHRLASF